MASPLWRADKRLGQHFLFDPSILARIVAAAGPLAGETVLEVGPGPGGLTKAILASDAAQVLAIDADPRSITALRPLEHLQRGRLRLLQGDALALDPTSLGADRPLIAIANLPYNVGTELLMRWLATPEAFRLMVLMFQREVALRLTAEPGTADYGRLAVMAQTTCTVARLFDLPPGAFVPPPKVSSSVVRLTPRADRPDEPQRRRLEDVTRAAFGQRRKMLRSSLGSLGVDTLGLLTMAAVDPTRRAETLSLTEFAALAMALGDLRRRETA
jgi:16S rRNA (adenine1518-N6/adenine1519-N6)-dimethyltransferase